MTFFKNILSTTLFIIILSSFLYSQDIPIEWEEIPMEDLQMRSYPADTSASALILCDYGYSFINNDLGLTFERHLRIKIFNENGYDMATQSIGIYEDAEYIDDVEGITYWLDDNGKIASAELDDDDIIEEKINEYYTAHKFTMPALRPGCIIDIKYIIDSENLRLVRDWIFQYSEPVRWSEYRLLSLSSIAFSAITRGYEIFHISEKVPTTKVVSGTAQSYVGNTIAPCNLLRWVVKDAPAIREENYMTCPEDYMTKVELQLSGYALRGAGVKTVTKDWAEFVEDELEAKYFGGMISTSGKVKDLAAKLTAGISEPEEKVKAIYHWVSQSVVWSGNNRRYPDKKMDEVIEQKAGNSADINMLLISLLRSAGITSYPFILSTRANGRVQDIYPISSQFNYVLAQVKIDTKDIYLDATDPLRPYDLLPQEVLYTKALAIKEGPVEWVTLGCERKNNTTNIIWMNIDEEGKLSGYFNNTYGEYQSLRIRNDLKDGKEKEIVKKLLDTEQYGLEIDSVVISDKDDISKPLKIMTYVTSENYAQFSGDMIYLNPNFIYREKENPFKSEVRKFPVNYSYQSCINNIFTINFPPGYEIKEPIKNKNFFAGAANINYNRKCAQEGNQLQMITKFDIKDLEVKPALYEKLRDFYSRVVAAQSEQIVLAKKNIQ